MLMFGAGRRAGRYPQQRRVHANVAFVTRKRPVHDTPLHRLRYPIVPFFDPLKWYIFGDHFGRDVQQRVRIFDNRAAAPVTDGRGYRTQRRSTITTAAIIAVITEPRAAISP